MRTSIRLVQSLALALVLTTSAGICLANPDDVTIQVRVFDADTGWGIPGAHVKWDAAILFCPIGSFGEGTTALSGSYSFGRNLPSAPAKTL